MLCEFTKTDGLRRHALAVEACVAAYARKFGEDETKWSVTALLHDFDWEIHPTLPDHPMKGEPILAQRGVDPRDPPGDSMGVDLDEHIAFCIDAMSTAAHISAQN
ncbi:MAG TPA: hypothetical protein VFW44_00550 [Bryobacteraceae bacterium]|nr:hypothetical protein [Bryobacteraceae bacterium]